MGAKASTANGEDAASRERSYSTDSMVGSASDIVAGSLLRSFQGLTTSDRQRARSLSSVPSGHENGSVGPAEQAHGPYDVDILDTENASEDPLDSPLAASIGLSLGLGRVYTARSLPSHIWSLNGIKCPVCSKFVLPDDVECHLVICLTKPRLNYNEDVLTCDKGECVICLEDLQQGDTIARLPCLCVYHKSCIDQWFDINRSCPEHPGD